MRPTPTLTRRVAAATPATPPAARDRTRGVFEHAAIGMAIIAPEGRWLEVNSALCEITGHYPDELLVRGPDDLIHPDDRAAEADRRARLLAGEIASYQLETRYVHAAGHVVWVLLTVSVLREGPGAPAHLLAQMQNLTEHRRADEAWARLTALLEMTPDIVAISTPDGRLPYVNRAGRRFLGIDGAPAGPAPTVADVQPQFLAGGALEEATRTAIRDGHWRGETTFRKRDGRELPVEQVLVAHRSSDGEVEYFSTIMRDISERRQTEATLRALAMVDELTGLYNRRGFLAIAEQEWHRAERERRPLLLFFMDLDNLKAINDTYGHAEGDAALRAVADVLRTTFREADVIARLAGDEFTALAIHGGGNTEAMVLARLARGLEQYNRASAKPYPLALSIGVARSEVEAPRSLATLMVEADAALYERKRARKGLTVTSA